MNNDRFNQVCSVTIAVITVMAAFLAYIQTDAAHLDDRANRDSKRYALEAFGLKVRGHAEAKFAYHEAFKSYYELQRLSHHADQMGEDVSSDIYEEAAAELTAHSRIFKDYFNAEDGTVDIARYEADTFVRQVALLEQQFNAASEVKAAWDTKATTYIVHLTLLAVSLFLVGQATTLKGDSTKKILYSTCVGLTLVTVVWATSVWAVKVPDLRTTGAIEFFANGVALDHQDLTKEAIAEYDQAIKAAPEYLDAYLARGQGHLLLGNYSEAAGDFKTALKLNPRSARVAANLAEACYEQGLFADSITFGKKAVQLAPEEIDFQGMLALATLGSGDTESAKALYGQLSALAAKTVSTAREKGEQPPAFIWERLDEISLDLEELSEAAESGEGTPPKDKIQNPEKVIQTSAKLQDGIDSLSVSLEYSGKPAQGELQGEFGELGFGLPKYDDEGELESEIQEFPGDVFPAGTGEVVVEFPHGKVPNGKDLVMRVFLDGVELPSWRMVDSWTYGDGDGKTDYWYKVLSPGYSETAELDPGHYLVEFFFDGHLALKDGFDIAEAE
jgi:tetratricopeptide (TPR) repeat protein